MSIEPAEGLFDRIILAIKREETLRHSKRLVFCFLFLLAVSCAAAPFSLGFLINQVRDSGILYFLSMAAGNLGVSLAMWQDFVLAIVESLPIMAIVIFTINMIAAVFTIRLFVYKKRLLLNYLIPQTI